MVREGHYCDIQDFFIPFVHQWLVVALSDIPVTMFGG